MTPERVLAALALLVPIVAMLWVPSYNKNDPALAGIPFFYWYQLLWVPASAVFTVAAYLLINRDEKARKAARNGGAR
ncbi:membrane protein [Streptomyces rubellomurinus subsp. indigoferus]|uniref:Membrane protein n=1 Tax=Streptomyces rubellomurinus (strain ATCC 31215) TaxID=359131 RepID=A0A0F2TAG5_STRR3|nr:membrane protein [Streptomyces rubellomurinus subsp. indigoferus]KJS60198.1 membrane protein [Streptomyces rubellomurinus]